MFYIVVVYVVHTYLTSVKRIAVVQVAEVPASVSMSDGFTFNNIFKRAMILQ